MFKIAPVVSSLPILQTHFPPAVVNAYLHRKWGALLEGKFPRQALVHLRILKSIMNWGGLFRCSRYPSAMAPPPPPSPDGSKGPKISSLPSKWARDIELLSAELGITFEAYNTSYFTLYFELLVVSVLGKLCFLACFSKAEDTVRVKLSAHLHATKPQCRYRELKNRTWVVLGPFPPLTGYWKRNKSQAKVAAAEMRSDVLCVATSPTCCFNENKKVVFGSEASRYSELLSE